MKMDVSYFDNDPDDFEIIDGKKVLRDGKTLRVKTTMMDSKSLYPVKISDGSGDPLSLNRPGFRMHTDAQQRTDRADIYTGYDDAKTNEWRDAAAPANTSPSWSGNPPTGQGAHDLPSLPAEGSACTINGYAGKWRHVAVPAAFRAGTEVRAICEPIGGSSDALTCYDHYDLEAADAWRGTEDARRRKEQWRDPEGRETGTVETDEDEDDDPFMSGAVEEVLSQAETHTESAQDRLQQTRDFGNQIAQQQEHRERVMTDAYAAYDRELMEQSRK